MNQFDEHIDYRTHFPTSQSSLPDRSSSITGLISDHIDSNAIGSERLSRRPSLPSLPSLSQGNWFSSWVALPSSLDASGYEMTHKPDEIFTEPPTSISMVPMMPEVSSEPTIRLNRSLSFALGNTEDTYTHLADNLPLMTTAYQHYIPTQYRMRTNSMFADHASSYFRHPASDALFNVNSEEELGKGIGLSQIPATAQFYEVQFGSNRTDLFYSEVVVPLWKEVLVEGDRGFDIGKVILEKPRPLPMSLVMDSNTRQTSLKTVKRIYRLAQPHEEQISEENKAKERSALARCRLKVRERQLQMEILRCEYQWDRRKITFYYRAANRVDFRDLNKELFKEYKARIWMCNIKSM